MYVFVRVFGFQEQELGHDQIRHVILDLPDQEHHALLEHARVDVVGALAATSGLDNHGNQAQGMGICSAVTLSNVCHYGFLHHAKIGNLLGNL